MPVKSFKNQGIEPRVAAAKVLAEVLDNGKSLDEALGHAKSLPDIDKKLVHAICGFVFRRLPEIDWVIESVTHKKSAIKPKILHHLIRVGIAQLLYMEIPPHAALNTTVSAAVSLNLFRKKSFINAVLRSVQRERDAILADPFTPLECLPEWLAASWVQNYGEDAAAAMAEAVSAQAPIDITLFDPKVKDEWFQKLDGEALLPWSIRLRERAGQVPSWPGFADGAWWVQDVASSIAVSMLGDVVNKNVLDVGAAPGGKTMQLLARGARVTALDDSAPRTTRLRDNLARVKGPNPVKVVVADARTWMPDAPFDMIVVDAPCSSTGTLRRHPELPWIRSEKDIVNLTLIQRDILMQASKMLQSGGVILYCTCSLQPEEGEIQVEAFLKNNKDFKELKDVPEAISAYLRPGLNDIGFRTFPHILAEQGGMDGFFIALLQKQ